VSNMNPAHMLATAVVVVGALTGAYALGQESIDRPTGYHAPHHKPHHPHHHLHQKGSTR
jgi:hypothetical protein